MLPVVQPEPIRVMTGYLMPAKWRDHTNSDFPAGPGVSQMDKTVVRGPSRAGVRSWKSPQFESAVRTNAMSQ
jgi:hypothetical protein